MQAVCSRKTVMLPVQLADERIVIIEADSSLTAAEACRHIATDIVLHDQFYSSAYMTKYSPHGRSSTCRTLFATLGKLFTLLCVCGCRLTLGKLFTLLCVCVVVGPGSRPRAGRSDPGQVVHTAVCLWVSSDPGQVVHTAVRGV